MTIERLQEIVRSLITCDGRGLNAKGAMLHELLQATGGDRLPFSAHDPLCTQLIADAVTGSCVLCGTRGHAARECPTRKR